MTDNITEHSQDFVEDPSVSGEVFVMHNTPNQGWQSTKERDKLMATVQLPELPEYGTLRHLRVFLLKRLITNANDLFFLL